MSQYPPFNPQPYYTPPGIDFSQYMPPAQVDLLAPARRASVLQSILAALIMACGICAGAFFWVFDVESMAAQARVDIQELLQGQTMAAARVIYTVGGSVALLIGITLLVLAFFVRKGGVVAPVMSLILNSLIGLYLLASAAAAVLMSSGNPVKAISGILITAVPASLIFLNIAWLIRAIRNSGQITFARHQYQAQYAQYQQQHYAYAQQPGGQYPPAGYGYGYPPAPPTGEIPQQQQQLQQQVNPGQPPPQDPSA